MAQTKGKRRIRRRGCFGKACGFQSRKYRIKESKAMKKVEERCKLNEKDKRSYPPYCVIKKRIYTDGKISCKVTVRRMHLSIGRKKKILRLSEDSLKFRIQENSEQLSGYRIINLDLLKSHICEITTHCCLCPESRDVVAQGRDPILLKSELQRNGLFSIVRVSCAGCKKDFDLQTSFKQNNGLYDINVRAVWGTAASGCGSTDLNEILTTMDIPRMNESKFTKLEQQIGDWWHDCLQEEMYKAASEEKRIAVEKGNYHQDVPAITVICDGGWSKRTHKHTYNAAGGVAVIFGAETKKLLFVGVRNKYCIICRKAENCNENPTPHQCYANWQDSSQAMEADIILEVIYTFNTK